MKIKIKASDETNQLLRDMASRDSATRAAAQEAFAEFVREPILTVINQAGIWGQFYTDLPFDKYNGLRTIPLDLYYDIKEVDYVPVWAQHSAGGAPTALTAGVGEMPFTVYELDSAISFKDMHLRHARTEYVSRALTKVAQEILFKQEKNRAIIALTALAQASTNVFTGPGGPNPATYRHVIRSYFAGQFNLQDYNRLRTRHDRIMSSWAGGTAEASQDAGVTDLLMSPEIIEFLRNLAFEPMNTRSGPTSDVGTEVGSTVGIAGPEALRAQIFNSAGVPQFFGVAIHKVLELGSTFRWNRMFDIAAGAIDYGNNGDGTSKTTFTDSSEQIIVGVNRNHEGLIRPVATDSEVGSTLQSFPDDQYSRRSETTGFFFKISEGSICVDSRQLSGLVV